MRTSPALAGSSGAAVLDAVDRGRAATLPLLIAEDNETNLRVLLAQLRLLDLRAESASNGREALERWRAGRYAMLLTDLHMPEMDGYDLTAAIRLEEAGGRRTPIVAVTANAVPDEANRCRAAGMDGYLTKPVRLRELKASIESWLPGAGLRAAHLDDDAIGAGEPLRAAPAVDLAALFDLIGDEPATVRDVIESFAASAALCAARMRAAQTSDSRSALQGAAHRLKSSARAIGALRLGHVCQQLEAASAAASAQEIARSLQAFDAEMEAVSAFLETYLLDRPDHDRPTSRVPSSR